MAKKSSINAEAVAAYITNWLKEYAINAKVNGFVVGISGGIDSAVTSTLCAQTGLPTLCIEMPIHQPAAQVTRAQQHIAQLKNRFPNVRSLCVDLTASFELFAESQDQNEPTTQLALTLANTRSRLRMMTLYYYAGLNGLLVAGTGNKIEDFGVGFFTKYGDGGVDISPIADLMKSEVFALAKALNVPESIQLAKPTDGLFHDDRSDEDQLGASYDELEWAMLEVAKNETSTSYSTRELEVLTIYKHLNRINQHKVKPIPVCEIPIFIK